MMANRAKFIGRPARLPPGPDTRRSRSWPARLSEVAELTRVDVAHPIGHFLDARDLESLPLLDDAHEVGGVEQRVVGAGVQPGGAAAELSSAVSRDGGTRG